MCNNLHNVCLHALTHEEDKILQEEAKVESKIWKKKFYAEKSRKEEEATKGTRQMEESLCRNACNICWNALSREEDNIFWKTTFKVWKPQIREERKTLHAASKKHVDELNHMKRCRWRVRKTHETQCSIQRRRDG